MATSITFQVKKANWLDNPNLRTDAGFDAAGLNWRTSNSRSTYPPLKPSYPERSYQLADQAAYSITESGRVMQYGGVWYMPFPLFGTRIWEGWVGHLDGSIDAMKLGFIAGYSSYSEG